MRIRLFVPEDAEACFQIRTAAFINLFYNDIGSEAVTNGVNGYLPNRLIQLAESYPFFVAEKDDQVMGFLTTKTHNEECLEILFLYVHLDCLGKQIGTALIDHLERYLKDSFPQIKRLVVDTAIPKYNQKFYEKVGFLATGSSECLYPDGAIEAIRLEKTII